jgi:hypothetical protein
VRERIHFLYFGKPFNYEKDELLALLYERRAERLLTPLQLMPPEETCTSYHTVVHPKEIIYSFEAMLVNDLIAQPLHPGGQLSVEGGKGLREALPRKERPGEFYGVLAQGRAFNPYLTSGTYTLIAPGGNDVQPFRSSTTIQKPVVWQNRTELNTIARDRDVTLRWKGGERDGLVAVIAVNIDQETTAMGVCFCLARARDRSFTVPSRMLANLPATEMLPGAPASLIGLISLPGNKLEPHAMAGLDAFFAFQAFIEGRSVNYR